MFLKPTNIGVGREIQGEKSTYKHNNDIATLNRKYKSFSARNCKSN
jgi:hypothetical protein